VAHTSRSRSIDTGERTGGQAVSTAGSRSGDAGPPRRARPTSTRKRSGRERRPAGAGRAQSEEREASSAAAGARAGGARPAIDRAELWVQPTPATWAAYEPIVERLRRLDREGVVGSVAVRTWDRYVPVASPLDPGAERLAAFQHWAGARGRDLPACERSSQGVGRMGPERTVLRTPEAVFAEYRDGVLVGVTPGAGEAACILARLADLERERDRSLQSALRRAGRRLAATDRGRTERRGGERPEREPNRAVRERARRESGTDADGRRERESNRR